MQTTIQCPPVLADKKAWLLWRYEQHTGEKKPRKVPYYANGRRRSGVQGNPQDVSNLASYDDAIAAFNYGNFDGIGFATLPQFNITALDFDNCMVDGGVHPDIDRLTSDTYTEISPSGNGVRAFYVGQLGDNKAHGEPYGFETFSSKGFVTFTGNFTSTCELLGNDRVIAPLSEDVKAFALQRFGKLREASTTSIEDYLANYEPATGLSDSEITELLSKLDPDMGHSDWLKVGMGLHHETKGEGFTYWDEWSAKGSKYPSSEALLARWDSFGNQAGKLVTLRSVIDMAKSQIASPEDFDAVVVEAALDKKQRFEVIPAHGFAGGSPPSWLVKHLLPKAGLAVMFGESGSGKSFAVLDMGMAIARGNDWRNLKTKQGRVVYVAAEGAGGFRNRLSAYSKHNDVDLQDIPFGVIHAAPNFLEKNDALDVAKAIVAGGPCALVIVDTFAQVMPGANENSGEDVGKALAHCAGIHRATGALVLLIHHSGKDTTKGARGWSGLRAAADAEIEILRTPTGRLLRVSKQKDGDDHKQFGFDLQVVPIGMDEDGDIIDSCVIVEADIPVVGKVGREYGKWEKAVIEVVSEIAESQTEGIELKTVIEATIKKFPKPDGKRDTRKQHVKRAIESLSMGDDAPYWIENDCLTVL